jgi:transposase
MATSISGDLRQRVVNAYKRGGVTYAQVAKQFAVGVASVNRWLRLDRETGSVTPKPHGGGRVRLIGDKESKVLDKLVLAHPDWTEDEFAKELSAKLGREFEASTVGRAIRRLGYGVKKRPSSRPSEIVPTSYEDENDTQNPPEASPLRVWFLWTKPASRRR